MKMELELNDSAGSTSARPPGRPFITPRGFVILAVYAVCAQVYTSLYFRVTVENPASQYIRLATLHAFRPYQYRILVPAVVAAIVKLLHANIYQYTPIYEDIAFLVVIALLAAFRKYLELFLSEPKAIVYSLALFLPLVMMHISCNMYRYPSDAPAILFFVLGLTAMARRRWPALYGWLLLASLNRESAGLLVLAFALTMWRSIPPKLFARHLIGLTALFLIVQIGLHVALAHIGGSLHEDHTAYNRQLLMKLAHLDPSVSITVLCLACVPLALSFTWPQIPVFLRLLLPLAPIYLVGMYFVGVLDEVRSYNEILLVVLTPLVLVFDRLVDGEKTPRRRASCADGASVTLDS